MYKIVHFLLAFYKKAKNFVDFFAIFMNNFLKVPAFIIFDLMIDSGNFMLKMKK